MALTLGVGALFFGVVFIIVGWKGQGVNTMNSNLAGMLKGQYPVGSGGFSTSTTTGPATSTTGGVHAPTAKPGATQPGVNP